MKFFFPYTQMFSFFSVLSSHQSNCTACEPATNGRRETETPNKYKAKMIKMMEGMKFVTHYKIHDVFKPCFMFLQQKAQKKKIFTWFGFPTKAVRQQTLYTHRTYTKYINGIVYAIIAILFKNWNRQYVVVNRNHFG